MGSCAVLVSSDVMESLMTIPRACLADRCVVTLWLFHPAHVGGGEVIE